MASILEGVEELGGGGGGGVPGFPTSVQALQQIVIGEINTALATKTNMAGGNNITLLFDKSMATGYATLAMAPATIHLPFQFPILIARVSIVFIGGGVPAISVTDVTGVVTVVTNDCNFVTPLMAVAIDIVPIAPTTIYEVVILKVIEVKTTVSIGGVTVDDTPATPLFVQDQNQLVLEEVTITVSAGVLSPNSIIDKDYTTFATLAAGARTITVTLKSPLLINRLGMVGAALAHLSVTATKMDGTVVTIVAINTSTVTGVDSFNFEPFYASIITITQGAGSPGSFIAELLVQKIIEVKSFSQVQLAQLTEFYGQKVSYDLFVNNVNGQTTVAYLLMRRALETDADNDPAITNDSTTVTMTSDIVDLERINAKFYVPHDDIRAVKRHVVAMATIECGSNARCTTLRYRIYKNAIATGTLTALTAVKSVTLNVDGSASRAVRAIMQDLVYSVIEEGSVLVLEIAVWGRQVASVAVPAPITLWHHRGLGDVKCDVECITQSAQVMI
jgi:hypothetical protein